MALILIFSNPSNQAPLILTFLGAKLYWTTGSDTNTQAIYALNKVEISATRRVTLRYPIGSVYPVSLYSLQQGVCVLSNILAPKVTLEQFIIALGDCRSDVHIKVLPLKKNTCLSALVTSRLLWLICCRSSKVNYTAQTTQLGLAILAIPLLIIFADMRYKLITSK